MAEIIISGDRHYVPDPSTPNLRIRFTVEEGTGKLSIQSTSDGGQTWQTILGELPSNAATGWVPTVLQDGSVSWLPIAEVVRMTTPTLPSYLQTWTDFSFPAELQNGLTFGMFEVPKKISFAAYGAQISIFSPPEITDLRISLIKENSSEVIAGPYLMGPSITYRSFTMPDEIVLSEGTRVVAKAEFDGNGYPGSFLVARLLLRGI